MDDFKPIYDADGNLGSVQRGNTFYPPEHVEFRAWLRGRGQTLDDFLAANPASSKPVPTWEDKRREAYRAEADPLRPEAIYDILLRGVSPETTAWAKAILAIKQRFPKTTETVK